MFYKRLLLCAIFILMCVSYSFGQEIIWTTVNGSSLRQIPLSSVKTQMINVSNQFRFFFYDEETPFISRATHRRETAEHIAYLQNKQNRDQETNRIINQQNLLLSWMDNNYNFVYAIRTEVRSFSIDSYLITVVNGSRVYMINFQSNNPVGTAFSSQASQNWLNQAFNSWLNGM